MSVGDAFVLLAIGGLAGAYGTVIGAGGGFLLAPLLVLLFDIEPAEVVGTSLGVVLVNGLSGTTVHMRQSRIDWGVALRVAILSLPASLAASYVVAEHVSGSLFKILLGVVLTGLALFVAARLLRPTPAERGSTPAAAAGAAVGGGWLGGRRMGRRQSLELVLAGAGLGFISGLFGIGAGFLLVPLLVAWLAMPTRIATATSILTLVPKSAGAFIFQAALGNVIWAYALTAGAAAMVGAQIGGRASDRMRPTLVLTLLAAATFSLGVFLIVDGSL